MHNTGTTLNYYKNHCSRDNKQHTTLRDIKQCLSNLQINQCNDTDRVGTYICHTKTLSFSLPLFDQGMASNQAQYFLRVFL